MTVRDMYVIAGLCVLLILGMMGIAKIPSAPIPNGTTKEVLNPEKYKAAFLECITIQPGYTESCKSLANKSSYETFYWSETKWVKQ